MKKRVVLSIAGMALAVIANAAEVTVDPNVSGVDTTETGVLNIWNTATNCNPLKADPASGTPSKSMVLHWENKLFKAQELNRSVGVGYDPNLCKITFVGGLR